MSLEEINTWTEDMWDRYGRSEFTNVRFVHGAPTVDRRDVTVL